jgi:NAD(P)-dependent dehydrogenase (short-subunit alcohol dehydrogenase family)
MALTNQSSSHDGSEGTIILTGANGSLGFAIASSLLQSYPSYFVILTVRDDSSGDENTIRLRTMASSAKSSNFSIEAVDLASLSSVGSFADSINERISTKTLAPIAAIICNAFNWSLTGQKNSSDGFDLSFQVSHLSHFVLVLKILGSVDRNHGRVVFVSSKMHDAKNKNQANPLGACLPDNLDELVRPTADKPGEELARGFQRYSNAKLASVMFMHLLNKKFLEVYTFNIHVISYRSTGPKLTPKGSIFKTNHSCRRGPRGYARLEMFQGRTTCFTSGLVNRQIPAACSQTLHECFFDR